MAKIQMKQVKSRINRPARQKRTLDALGLKKLNHSVIHEATPQVLGMVNAVRHLVEVTNVD
ncbi:MAG: 50S ribosomal protein L30 [Muribaculaceae bacterium]|nr:50S ribosomal protein L30 [Muribaculaceae bacterium]